MIYVLPLIIQVGGIGVTVLLSNKSAGVIASLFGLFVDMSAKNYFIFS